MKYLKDFIRQETFVAIMMCIVVTALLVMLFTTIFGHDAEESIGSSEKVIEAQVSDYQDDLKSQHLKICKLDTKQLALDLVYIDYHKSTRYALYLTKIGSEDVKKSEDEKTFEQNAIEYYEGSPEHFDGYSEDDFEKLCKALDEDQYKRSMAMSLVRGFIGYDEGQLAVPTNNLKTRELLKYSWYDPSPLNHTSMRKDSGYDAGKLEEPNHSSGGGLMPKPGNPDPTNPGKPNLDKNEKTE